MDSSTVAYLAGNYMVTLLLIIGNCVICNIHVVKLCFGGRMPSYPQNLLDHLHWLSQIKPSFKSQFLYK